MHTSDTALRRAALLGTRTLLPPGTVEWCSLYPGAMQLPVRTGPDPGNSPGGGLSAFRLLRASLGEVAVPA